MFKKMFKIFFRMFSCVNFLYPENHSADFRRKRHYNIIKYCILKTSATGQAHRTASRLPLLTARRRKQSRT